MYYDGERIVKKFGKRKCVKVKMTEKAVLTRPDHVYQNGEVYWIERPEDEYGWHHYEHFRAVKVTREDWNNGTEC